MPLISIRSADRRTRATRNQKHGDLNGPGEQPRWRVTICAEGLSAGDHRIRATGCDHCIVALARRCKPVYSGEASRLATTLVLPFESRPLSMWLNAVPKTDPVQRSPAPASDAPERAQVERIRAGDATAFEALFRTYYAALASFAFAHTDSREVAEEIVQDLFLSIWTRRAEWEVTTHLRSYLYVATLNRVRSFRRSQRAHHAANFVLAMERNGGGEREAPERTDDALAHQEALTAIRAAIAALPERTREVFLLNRDGGLSYREVAVRLGITVKTVEFHMGRALASLRERLAEWQ